MEHSWACVRPTVLWLINERHFRRSLIRGSAVACAQREAKRVVGSPARACAPRSSGRVAHAAAMRSNETTVYERIRPWVT
jgi:hypothetical protein